MTWAISHEQVPRMILYTLKQADDGQWGICRRGIPLFMQMQLAAAIKLAREAARDEHYRSGQPTCVEMRGLGSLMRLAHYPQQELGRQAATA